MKRAVSVALSVIQAILLAGAGALVWLDKKSMGVMRYMANKNRIWSRSTWAGWAPALAAVAAAALLIWAVVMMASSYKKKKRTWALLAVSGLFAATFIFMANTDLIRAYYFLSFIFAAITLFQWVKCLLDCSI
jgi:hypothetical protein